MMNLFTRYFFYTLLLLNAMSCGSEESNEPKLKASFYVQNEVAFVGTEVYFIDESTGTTENTLYTWNFGDGNSSTLKSPSHTYLEIGTGFYEVVLTLKSGAKSNVIKKTINVSLTNDIEGRKSLIEKLADTSIITCAHRGNHNLSPENSIGSINDAITEGIGMIEIDIRETRDGKLVLMHDASIDRTTNGAGKVSDYTLAELQEFKLYHNGFLTNEIVPSLEEALVVSRGKIYMDLDISKKASFERVYPIVKQFGMLKQVLYYSSKLEVIKTMLNKDSDVIAMPIIDGDDRFNEYANLNGIKVVHYTNDSFYQRLVEEAKARGWYIFMNAYVNTTTVPVDDNYAQVDRIIDLAGNIIQTDTPVLVQNYLNN